MYLNTDIKTSRHYDIMRFEISDKKRCDEFINIFNHLKHFTDNINLMVNPDKLYIQGMDQSHVCVYELSLDKTWFNVWDVSSDETYGIHIPIFNKILHTCSDKQTIKVYSNDSDKLEIEFSSEAKGDFNKFFEIPLMDIDSDLLNIPDCDYEVDITMDAKKFKSLVDELSNFSDTLDIQCNEGNFSIEANGDAANMKVIIDMNDIDSYSVIEDETVNASFGIRYLSQMCQFHKLATNCSIYISRNIPIQIKYEMNDSSMMRFYLAPKIDD